MDDRAGSQPAIGRRIDGQQAPDRQRTLAVREIDRELHLSVGLNPGEQSCAGHDLGGRRLIGDLGLRDDGFEDRSRPVSNRS